MTIAFFDFDGTITNRDTLWEIIRFHRGRAAMYAGIVQLLPALLQFKLKMIPAQAMKEEVLGYFFREMPASEFTSGCDKFCRERLPLLIRPLALAAIRKHQQQGHHVVVVTASAQDWVAPWCRKENIVCLGTRLEVKDKLMTGKIQDINCNGEEKVRRIRQAYRLENFSEIYAYGDSEGDRPMLALAKHAHFKPFR
ncbi:MAG: HAD-IB family hydrolase [Chitinophaga sp.]|uniref:HAD-IB family hydrolase n=1 Tax=Chitinophaga sp. TaxID=1869181 RepID=UPI001B0BA317|nr:HAD-IB family hydrolase [Chitinophaga sp.]MBO9731181.1 HAD-IB family hydrolase [Chitinophaga sp.]